MNKKYSKNETKQSTRKREIRPASRDSASTRRHIRAVPVTNLESGINLIANVSSSGTNLNRKIELELARLDSVEKKIRKHKCKTTAVTSTKTPSNNPSNQRKLRNILENMLSTIDYAAPKIKKYAPYQQKVRQADFECLDAGKKCVKLRKTQQNPKKVESFTNIFNNTNKRAFKSNFHKTDNVFMKSALKKPMSAPNGTRNSVFVDDLKFAESLRFGKKVDLHFMLEDIKKIVQTSTNNPHQVPNHELTFEKNNKNVKFDSNAPSTFKVIVEQPSENKISYIYDSPSFNGMDTEYAVLDRTKSSNEPIKPLKKLSPYGSVVKMSKSAKNKDELNTKEIKHENKVVKEKPEEKEFYSYLRRGNFIISGNLNEPNQEVDEGHISEHHEAEITDERSVKSMKSVQRNKLRNNDIEMRRQVLENNVGQTEEAIQVLMSGKHSETKISFSEKTDIYPGVCDFPTDLLERSILAVENVLNTIDCIANEFNQSSEIKDPLPVEVETLNTLDGTSVDTFLKTLNEDGLGDSNNNYIEKFQDAADGDQLSNSKKNSSVMKTTLRKASIGSFSVSRPTILCSGDSNSVQVISKISQDSAKLKANSFSTGLAQIDVLFLKPPVTYFLNSEENFPDSMNCRNPVLTEKGENQNNPKIHEYVALNDEDDVDPLMKALESLRTRVNAIEEEMVDISPKISDLKLQANVPKCMKEDLPEDLCSEHSKHSTSVKEVLISQTVSDTSCRSFATSQSENNFTLNHSYSISCSSNGSRASSCRKLFIPPNSSSKMFNRTSNRIFNAGRNRGNSSYSGSYRESVRKRPSKIFPDYYIDRCMKLLGKKFKDFDKLRRQKVFDKKSYDSMKSFTFDESEKVDVPRTITSRNQNITPTKRKKSLYEQTEMLWINNTKENYKVCFKNEHFNNRSETSIESHSKEITNIAKKKNVYTISRIKSSP
ncbi:hypothetical protein WA026_005948 [Henosepilachna vigintioctopunctata]|uniref:Uncharacterized protein n=1 Tax=Henosepilachna vigintioctopunctata TaxID=420089 RepID=A0AAW1TUE6_9CUCU